MPLLQIIGVTPTNITLSIAFVFIYEENEYNYTWALSFLKSTMDGYIGPCVIVKDRELSMKKICNNVFVDAIGLLYKMRHKTVS